MLDFEDEAERVTVGEPDPLFERRAELVFVTLTVDVREFVVVDVEVFVTISGVLETREDTVLVFVEEALRVLLDEEEVVREG